MNDEEQELLTSDNRAVPVGTKLRNLIAFWFLGLCNNFGYVVMLSAAKHILDPDVHTKPDDCATASVGLVLLADILPALFVKIFGPFINLNTHFQVFLVVVLGISSFIFTSFSEVKWIGYIGVIAASVGSGLGEISFLKYSSRYHRNVVSAWASGTGAAGVAGAFAYAVITGFITPKHTLRLMTAIPIFLGISFWVILEHVDVKKSFESDELNENKAGPTLSFSQKVKLLRPLLKYMIPLGLVYFAEYFINQGLTQLLTFDIFTPNTQYEWYQVCYQVGVFISRSSVNILHIKQLWIMSVLQIVNAVFVTFEAFFGFLPSFWIVVVLILYEGLLGGATYVNAFYRISEDVSPRYREFSLGVTSLADSLGITLAAFAAIGAHNLICMNRRPRMH